MRFFMVFLSPPKQILKKIGPFNFLQNSLIKIIQWLGTIWSKLQRESFNKQQWIAEEFLTIIIIIENSLCFGKLQNILFWISTFQSCPAPYPCYKYSNNVMAEDNETLFKSQIITGSGVLSVWSRFNRNRKFSSRRRSLVSCVVNYTVLKKMTGI
jgi:hypothetical protein